MVKGNIQHFWLGETVFSTNLLNEETPGSDNAISKTNG